MLIQTEVNSVAESMPAGRDVDSTTLNYEGCEIWSGGLAERSATYVWHNIFPPGVSGQKIREPVCRNGLGILIPVVELAF